MERKAKILLVDDEPIILEMYSIKFKKAGMEIFTACSADEGLKIVEKEKIDVIFLDIVMPEKDGFWLLKKIKSHKDKKISNIPVIMLSNLDDPKSRRKCCELGCLYYLVKPQHTPAQLIQMVEDVLEVRKR